MNRFEALLDSDEESIKQEVGSHERDDIDSSSELSRNDCDPTVLEPTTRQVGGLVTSRIASLNGFKLDENQQLCLDLGFDDEELATCVRVLECLSSNPDLLKLPRMRPLRSALDPIVKEQVKRYNQNDGKNDTRKKRSRHEKHTEADISLSQHLAQQQSNEKLKDREYINKTQLRAARLLELEKLNDQQDVNVPRIPDGFRAHSNLLISNEAANDSSFIHRLSSPLSCYICRKSYYDLHFFYSQLCPDCATLNYKKRSEMADLTGYISLVTGGRTKIGFCTALKLLRCGATVLVTSRFPFDCVSRYKKEADWNVWSARLRVFALDFRNIQSVELFCQYIDKNFPHLDIVINNAAQTVRRPAAYYAHLIPGEKLAETYMSTKTESNANDMLHCLEDHFNFNQSMLRSTTLNNLTDGSCQSSYDTINKPNPRISPSTAMPYELSQMIVLPEDTSTWSFPEGATDSNGQQVDLRQHNSWTMRLHEVSTQEMAEVFAINAIAPTVINARLKTVLTRSPHKYKFIVNVSAMEGKFYRFKTDKHPHTNMAKAALNMQTRTCAQDYVKSGIYITSVDTGWINDEKPIERAVRHQKKDDFQTPIDEIDAAARVLDPIIAPLALKAQLGTDVEPPFGWFLKDFTKSEW